MKDIELKGTEKQIEYAKTIIKGFQWSIDKEITKKQKMIEKAIEKGKDYERFSKKIEELEEVKAKVPFYSDNAVWYIENKNLQTVLLVKRIIEGKEPMLIEDIDRNRKFDESEKKSLPKWFR